MNWKPVLMSSATARGKPLSPLTVGVDSGGSEGELQELLFANPELLGSDGADTLIPLAMEVSTESGPLDILYVDRAGRLTIVETKLLKNPQAKREVISQVIDYAAALSRMSYDDLNDAVCDAGGRDLDAILDASIVDVGTRQHCRSRLATGLPVADFDLLIVGDRISEQASLAVSAISAHPSLRFRITLVELQMYRLGDSEWPRVLVPRVVERIEPVERLVVRIECSATATPVRVSVGPTSSKRSASAPPGAFESEEDFLASPDLPDGFAALLRKFIVKWRAGGGESAHSRRLLRWTFTDARSIEHSPLNVGVHQVSPPYEPDDESGMSSDDHAAFRAAIASAPYLRSRLDAGGSRIDCIQLPAAEFGLLLDGTLVLLDRWRLIR